MNIRVPLLVLLLGSLAPLLGNSTFAHAEARPEPSVGVAPFAQQSDDLDCEDFETQEEAQAALDDDPADPNNLDPNQDGIACALLPSAEDVAAASADEAAAQDADAGNQTAEERRAARKAARQQNQDGGATEEATPADTGNQTQEERRAARQANETEAPAVTCADYETQEEAQAAFDEDPEGLAGLDADANGVACEELAESVPTTEPEAGTEPAQERRRNRRNQEEEAAPTEVVIDEPRPVRISEDFDCVDFEFQEEAQKVYDEDRTDPYNLDPSGDGIACSSLPSSSPRVSQVPRTGIGTASGLDTGFPLAAILLSTLGAAAASWRGRLR
jgi:hypothetical protein